MTARLDTDELYRVLLEILAITVLIDKREKDKELIEFCHAAMLLNQQLRPGKIMSKQMLEDWFERHKGGIKQALANDADNRYKLKLLSHVTDKTLQRRLLSSIFTIAICDYELHDEESDFIKTALKLWDTDMPTSDEVEAHS